MLSGPELRVPPAPSVPLRKETTEAPSSRPENVARSRLRTKQRHGAGSQSRFEEAALPRFCAGHTRRGRDSSTRPSRTALLSIKMVPASPRLHYPLSHRPPPAPGLDQAGSATGAVAAPRLPSRLHPALRCLRPALRLPEITALPSLLARNLGMNAGLPTPTGSEYCCPSAPKPQALPCQTHDRGLKIMSLSITAHAGGMSFAFWFLSRSQTDKSVRCNGQAWILPLRCLFHVGVYAQVKSSFIQMGISMGTC